MRKEEVLVRFCTLIQLYMTVLTFAPMWESTLQEKPTHAGSSIGIMTALVLRGYFKEEMQVKEFSGPEVKSEELQVSQRFLASFGQKYLISPSLSFLFSKMEIIIPS